MWQNLPSGRTIAGSFDNRVLMRPISQQLVDAFSDFGKWWHIALFTLKRQYTNTHLGPLWVFLPHLFFVAVVGSVYATAFSVSGRHYYAHVAFGYVVWVFILDSFSRGGNLFVNEYGRFDQIQTNLFGIILKDVIARGIVLVVNLAVCIVAFVIANGEVHGLEWLPLGLSVLFINSFLQSYSLSALSARFRDLPPITSSVMRLMLFVTPIFWFAESFRSGPRVYLLHVNPFYPMIELVRSPLIDGTVPHDVPMLALLWTIVNAAVFAAVASTCHRRIVYDAA